MRNSKAARKTVYVRFHRDLDVMTEKFCKKTGMKRATAISWIIDRYFAEITEKFGGVAEISKDRLGFLPQGEAYFLMIGRSDEGRVAGKRTIITLDKTTARDIDYLSVKFGLTPSQLRTEILVKYYIENNIE